MSEYLRMLLAGDVTGEILQEGEVSDGRSEMRVGVGKGKRTE